MVAVHMLQKLYIQSHFMSNFSVSQVLQYQPWASEVFFQGAHSGFFQR